MIRTCFLAAVVFTGFVGALDAQPFPRLPYPPPVPQPLPPGNSPIDGPGYFRPGWEPAG